jgi:hypothetical protein
MADASTTTFHAARTRVAQQDPLSRSRIRSWIAIAVLFAADVALAGPLGFRFDWGRWLLIGGLAASLVALSRFYRKRRAIAGPAIPSTLHETAILVAYGPPAASLSYIVVAMGMPLADVQLAAWDRAIGFDWVAWFDFVEARPFFNAALHLLYMSSLPQIGVVLIWTGLAGHAARARELVALLIWSSIPVVVLSGLLPAESAWVFNGRAIELAYHLEHVRGLRDGSMRQLAPGDLLGIITFPSFHTAISIIVVWAARGLGKLFWILAAVNAGVLLSIPSAGGHYLVDMLAGAALTVGTIALRARFKPTT